MTLPEPVQNRIFFEKISEPVEGPVCRTRALRWLHLRSAEGRDQLGARPEASGTSASPSTVSHRLLLLQNMLAVSGSKTNRVSSAHNYIFPQQSALLSLLLTVASLSMIVYTQAQSKKVESSVCSSQLGSTARGSVCLSVCLSTGWGMGNLHHLWPNLGEST